MLNDQEQRSWKDIEQSYAAEAVTPDDGDRTPVHPRTPTRDPRSGDGIGALTVGAVGIAIMFAVIGAPWAGLVVVLAPALAWVLTRYWRDIGDACATALVPVDGWVADDAQSHRLRREPEDDREGR